MGHSEKILVFVLVLIALGRGQALDSSISNDVSEVTTLNPVEVVEIIATQVDLSISTQSLPSTDKIKNSVRILDFVGLTEEKHEAEFILDLVEEFPHRYNKTMISSGVLDSKLLKFREEEILQDNILPGSHGLKKVRKMKVTIPCTLFYALYPYDLAVCTFVIFPGGGPSGSWESSMATSTGLSSHAQLCSGGMDAYEFHVKGYLPVVLPGGNTTGVDMLTISLLVQRTSSTQVISQMYSPILTLVCISFLTMSKGTFFFRIGTSSACLIGMILSSTMFWWFIPREKDGQTFTEYYITFCVGFTFQVVLTNILMYRYLLKDEDKTKENVDVEANGDKSATNGTENGTATATVVTKADPKAKSKLKILPKEMHILKMGKFHQWVYFKCLRPASWQLPVFFLIFNLIYWPLLLYLSSGLPAGFMPVPEPQTELDKLCL